jgi:hypothetical protein
MEIAACPFPLIDQHSLVMFADLLVNFYRLVHGRLHLPGAGWLLRRFAPLLPHLQAYPLPLPEVGVAIVDFRKAEAYGMVDLKLYAFDSDCG